MTRVCGGCTLCCKLIPVDLSSGHKIAGVRCPHQRTGKGCAIYAKRPLPCVLWNCVWLLNADVDNMRRPDRSHYVIDILPDFITLTEDDRETRKIEVVQIWVDRDYPDAYKDPALLAYLERRGKKGVAAIIRYSEHEGFVMFPPAMTEGRGFVEHRSGTIRPERTSQERFEGVMEARRAEQ
jgi:hypothetical protein